MARPVTGRTDTLVRIESVIHVTSNYGDNVSHPTTGRLDATRIGGSGLLGSADDETLVAVGDGRVCPARSAVARWGKAVEVPGLGDHEPLVMVGAVQVVPARGAVDRRAARHRGDVGIPSPVQPSRVQRGIGLDVVWNTVTREIPKLAAGSYSASPKPSGSRPPVPIVTQ